jgi:hypothetical protein
MEYITTYRGKRLADLDEAEWSDCKKLAIEMSVEKPPWMTATQQNRIIKDVWFEDCDRKGFYEVTTA